MSETLAQLPLVSGMVLGGVVISTIGAGSTYFMEEKVPTVKSLTRDFLIGSMMVAFLLQLLPESTSSLIQFLLGLAPLALFQRGGGGGSAATGTNSIVGAATGEAASEGGSSGGVLDAAVSLLSSVSGGTTAGGGEEVEVKVGVPKF
jgi:hypothetical protein